MVFSPGPANIVFAASGVKQGVKKSIPLIIGVNLVFVVYSLIIGFGFGEFLKHYPDVIFVVQLLGVIYITYLTYKFIRPQKHKQINGEKTYTFVDGVILQMLNPKGLSMLFLMFSVLLDGSFNQIQQVIYLVIMLAVLNISTHFIWVAAGSSIAQWVSNPKVEQLLNYFFAVSLLLVAVWLLLPLYF